MNKLSARHLKTVLALLILFSSVTKAQVANFNFLQASASDAGLIMNKYISPWANAFGAGLSGGWYNTAKPHKFGGFDITGSISVGIVPSSEGTFSLSSVLGSNLSNYTVTGTGIASTVAGPATSTTTLTKTVNVSGTQVPVAKFNMPEGANWNYVPVPMLQVGIGLPLGSELKVRYLPKINLGNNGDINLIGFGLMHSIMQYIPGHKLSPFDVSIFGGYTKLVGNVKLKMQPDYSFGATNNFTGAFVNASIWDNQKMKITVAAYNISAIASVNLKVITLYGGLGYSKTNTVMKLSGNFPIPTAVTVPTPRIEYNNTSLINVNTLNQNLDFKNQPKLRANIGFRLKLGVFTIHIDYTRALYNVVTAGMGLSFR
jgi:hypothetical protein